MTNLLNKRQKVSEHSWKVYKKDIKPLILHINCDLIDTESYFVMFITQTASSDTQNN